MYTKTAKRMGHMVCGGSVKINIREMACSDLCEVEAMEREIFSEPWSEKGFADAIAEKQNIFLVAERCMAEAGAGGHESSFCTESSAGVRAGGRIAGYCGIYIAGDEGEITNVAVAAGERQRGTGSALLDELCARAERRGVQRIFLEVRVSNRPAIRLYEKHGFVPCGMRRDFYRFPAEDALCMRLLTKTKETLREELSE